MRITRPEQVSQALGIPFSDQQLAAICAPLEPGVVIAGAGSGKTAVMAARVVWLVGTGQVAAEQVLGLTFTRKAAAELGARIRDALRRAGASEGEDFGEPLVSTYDSFAGRLVGEHGLRIGLDGEQRMVSGAARHRLAHRVVVSADGPLENLSTFQPTTVVERLLALDAQLSSHLVDPERVVEYGSEFLRAYDEAPKTRYGNVPPALKGADDRYLQRIELLELVDAYRELKRDLGWVEFADQMAIAARLATGIPEVGADLRREFKVVLLDEYQDTSSAQAQLLHALFGDGHPVTAVGDPHQAIYGWRGAAASNILTFADTFLRVDGGPARAYGLTVNRRSGQLILDAANRVAASLRAAAGTDSLGVNSDLVAPTDTPSGEIITASFDTWPDEIEWVADRVVALKDSGQVTNWADIGILFRRNSHIGDVHAALTERGVPAEILGIGGLLSVPEVADVVATLKVVADPGANTSLVRLLTGPRWQVGPSDLRVLGRRARELAGVDHPDPEMDLPETLAATLAQTEDGSAASLAEAMDNPGTGPYSTAGRARIGRFAEELRSLRRHTHEPVENLARRIVAASGMEVELLLRGEGGTAQLEAFFAAVAEYAAVDGDGSLTGLLSYLDAEERYEVGLEQADPVVGDAVQLLTVHRAKGLEWSAVFLPSLVEKVFPDVKVSDNWLKAPAALPADLRGDADSIPQLAEVTGEAAKEYDEALKLEARRSEDRLAYVAVTRARQVLVATAHSWSGELKQPREPSGYLEQIQSESERLVNEPASETNPLFVDGQSVRWPAELDPDAAARRLQAAAVTAEAQAALRAGDPPSSDPLSHEAAARVAEWDAAATLLLAEAHAARSPELEVALPRYLSTSAVMALNSDPITWALNAIRPMPRPPVRASRVGEQFHSWLERRFGSATTFAFDEDEPSAGDSDIDNLIGAFENGMFADRTPSEVEVPFSLVLGGQVVRGRIDAVYTDGSRPLVVDWKTGRRAPDPLQLAVYRVAWAELSGLEVDQVDASFYDVLAGQLFQPNDLPGRAELEDLIAGITELG